MQSSSLGILTQELMAAGMPVGVEDAEEIIRAAGWKCTGATLLIASMLKKAIGGDVSAAKLIREMNGESAGDSGVADFRQMSDAELRRMAEGEALMIRKDDKDTAVGNVPVCNADICGDNGDDADSCDNNGDGANICSSNADNVDICGDNGDGANICSSNADNADICGDKVGVTLLDNTDIRSNIDDDIPCKDTVSGNGAETINGAGNIPVNGSDKTENLSDNKNMKCNPHPARNDSDNGSFYKGYGCAAPW